MTNTIDQFKSIIGKRNGLAKSNRFNVFMNPPQSLYRANELDELRDLNVMCESCSMPGRQIQTFDMKYFRQDIKTPQGFINEDISFVFNLTNDFFIKRLFDDWTNLIIDRESYKLNYSSVYKRSVEIYQLDSQNQITYKVELKNAFPVSVQAVELGNANGDVQQVTVEFTYEDFIETEMRSPYETAGLRAPINFVEAFA
jgi:hypothetical protein|tara:strand:- start:124 stop:720 length:597 start_codon:yes stop_codon:yes gene_type:complete